jgi:plastocyanin
MLARLFATIAILSASSVLAQTPESHDDHAAQASAGLKKELFAHVTEADFLKLSDKPKTVKITLVATYTAENYGMNFNGYAKGKAIYTLPVGWTAEVEFINPSPVPHSVVVIDLDQTKKLQVPEPYFKGGAVDKHLLGIAFAKAAFTFTADEAGEYAFACGFPAHGVAGHWVALNISADAKAPTLQLGDKPAVEAK